MRDLKEITIAEVAMMLQKKEISVKELTQEYIKHIKIFDQGEHGLNSVLELNPEAMELAKDLDEQLTNNKNILFGIPILLKDNIDTADQMHTSAGSLALADSKALADAEIVKGLRAKGALIIGKTNMTEFANYMTKGMPAGYSSRGGTVYSPYHREKSPSGSSTGSAVAVTANLCTASLGTDTSGSIISPAIKNGIVGFRPSIGALNQKGIIPISFTCDSAGPMTRTVSDAAIIFMELTGIPINLYHSQAEQNPLTIGINEYELKDLSGQDAKKAEAIIKTLKKEGFTLKRIHIEPMPIENIKQIERYEFKFALNRYLGKLPNNYPIRSLKDIIEFNDQNREKALKYGQTLLIDAEENTIGDLSESEYKELLLDREHRKKSVMEALRGYDVSIFFKENMILQYTGMPIITIPHGLNNDGMPYGISMTSFNDTDLLKNALRIEQIIGNRVPPKV
ncbi:MAG: amidase family protein [Herbinix sp.]|nr:amidase family protein [Herbinix sp.]